MKNAKYRRKQYIIDKQFQFRFIASFLLLIIVSLVVFSAGFAAFYWFRYMAGENVFKEFIHIQKEVKTYDDKGNVTGTRSEMVPGGNRLELILPPVLINNLLIMILLSILGIFRSHRIAGPVYRMEMDIMRVLQGEKAVKIRLRKKDKLKSLADKINRLIEEREKSAPARED